MSTLTKIDPKSVADGLKAGRFHLIDIREADEFAREHIGGAVSIPLSSVEQADVKLEAGRTVVFHCKSGMRTEANCAKLAARVDGDALILEGGLDAWKKAGLPVKDNAKAPLPMNRQVQITAGTLVLAGALIGAFVASGGLRAVRLHRRGPHLCGCQRLVRHGECAGRDALEQDGLSGAP
jgi:rhodanese-related sulfurtransferase